MMKMIYFKCIYQAKFQIQLNEKRKKKKTYFLISVHILSNLQGGGAAKILNLIIEERGSGYLKKGIHNIWTFLNTKELISNLVFWNNFAGRPFHISLGLVTFLINIVLCVYRSCFLISFTCFYAGTDWHYVNLTPENLSTNDNRQTIFGKIMLSEPGHGETNFSNDSDSGSESNQQSR